MSKMYIGPHQAADLRNTGRWDPSTMTTDKAEADASKAAALGRPAAMCFPGAAPGGAMSALCADVLPILASAEKPSVAAVRVDNSEPAFSDPWLTPREAAERAKLSLGFLLRATRNGNGPRMVGKRKLMRCRASWVDAWVANGFKPMNTQVVGGACNDSFHQ